ncbi:MAG: ATP synthase F1 subunit epsilon [Thermoanaerobaculia bacterium]
MDGRLALTVVTPERALLSGVLCDEVTLPAWLGEIGVLPGHTPLIALLGIGVVGYRDGGRRTTLAVRGGFVEIAGDEVRILADEAAAPESVDGAKASADKADAENRRAHAAGDEELDAANADARFAEARLAVSRPA